MGESQKRTVDALLDWSKWMIGLGFAAGAGCILVLRGAPDGLPRLFLVLATWAFALSVLCAALLVHGLAALNERLPLDEGEGGSNGIRAQRIGPVSIGGLARMQLALTAAGGLGLIAWVALLPAD
jgi:hypothetical protein